MSCVYTKFKTESDAEAAINHIKKVRRKYRRLKRPVRYYVCEVCKCYHLTSKAAIPEEVNLIYEDKFKLLLK
jgi:hypothetical protein